MARSPLPEGAFVTHSGRAWPLQGKRYARPDIVTLINNTEVVVFVGDAKRHKRLERRDVNKVAMYRDVTKAESAAVFVPTNCKVADSVLTHAQNLAITIVRL